MPELAKLVPLAEAARLLGVTPQWLREQCRERRYAHTRIARQYRFTPGQLEALLVAHEVTPQPVETVPAPAPAQRRQRVTTRRHATFGGR